MVLFEVDTDQLVKRVSGRRTCEFCKKVFNVNFAPPVRGECVPGRTEHQPGAAPRRPEETFKERLRKYEEDTRMPVSRYYAYTGLMRTVDADGEIDAITQRLLDTLKAGWWRPSPRRRRSARRSAAPSRPRKSRARKAVRRTARKVAKKAAPKRRAGREEARKVARKPARRARPTRTRRKSKR